ncbi:sigma-54-dependent Fis family transcriptional regulator [bacterium]|nr:sigma-54-dependent Fis family transcriptional regulator [bacterium]
MRPLTILLIDDEDRQLQLLKEFLTYSGFDVFTANKGPDGYEIAQKNTIDLVLTDFRMPEWNGLEVLKKIKGLNPDIDVVVMTAFRNVEDALEIMKAGAYDYLAKPVDMDELENLVKRVQEKRMLAAENRLLKQQLQQKYNFSGIFSQSGEMEEVLNMAGRVAPGKTTVLVRGESGTGKELITKAIHFASPRKDKPFVVVNVAALSESLLESELFGYEKGAFTGANHQRIGRFEQADGGTLFIDEVGDIPLSVQVKLLRAIQFGQIERLGGNKTISVDVRIVAATNRNIEEMIKNGEFREDLYYRLNVVTIWLPPLRKRKADIPLLAEQFIKKFSQENKKNVKGVSREALDLLMKHDFPGNVRELENIIERAVVFCRDEYITRQDLPSQFGLVSEKDILNPHHLHDGYKNKMRQFETEMIQEAINICNGNQRAAARLLNITERHLRYRLEKLGLK